MAGMHVGTVLDVLKESFRVYGKAFGALKTALLVVFLLQCVFFVAQAVLGISTDPMAVLSPAYLGLAIAVGLVTGLIELAMIKPIYNVATGGKAASWTAELPAQAVNLLKVIAAEIIFFLPSIILMLVAVALIMFAPAVSMVAWLLVMLVLFAQCIMLFFISPFLLPQIVLEKNGIMEALNRSIGLAKENILPIIAYYIALIVIIVAMYLVLLVVLVIVMVLLGIFGGPAAAQLGSGILTSAFTSFFYLPWFLATSVLFWNEAKKAHK